MARGEVDGAVAGSHEELWLVPVVDAAGPEMDRGETVTVLNDLVVLTPGALVDARARWTAVDAQHVRGVFTNACQRVSAELMFNEAGNLVDFVSDDRLRALADGKSFTAQRWSTPLAGHRDDAHGQRVLASGEGRWFTPAPEGWFTYVELHFDDVVYNVHRADGTAVAVPAPQP